MPPDAAASKPIFRIASRVVVVPIRPAWVMGIVNVTPDSFSDGGEFFDRDRAVARGLQQIEEGADILDIGAESTRPGSSGVSATEQIHRAVPVIEQLRRESPGISISIDTTSAEVAQAAIKAGADIVNDTSALRDDPKMIEVAARANASVILMHRRGSPIDMQSGGGPNYENLIPEIADFLRERIEFAVQGGIERCRIALDPGVGFGKQGIDNLKILGSVRRFAELGLPVLIGASRKKFIGDLLNLTQPRDRMIGSVACAAVAALDGASIIRAHDVLQTVQALKVVYAVSSQ